MRMAIDEPGENRHRPSLDPADRFGPLPPVKIIIIARCGDPSVFDNDGPIPSAAQVAKFRRIDQETANAKQFTVLYHSAPPMKTSHRGEAGNPAVPSTVKDIKKIRAAHAKEKQQIPETCDHPNRLNLLIWTPGLGPRSNFLRKIRTRTVDVVLGQHGAVVNCTSTLRSPGGPRLQPQLCLRGSLRARGFL